jgi:hypothetical protein
MSTIDQPSATNDDRREASEAATLAYLHGIYRGDLGTLQVAIASAQGEQLARLRTVFANLTAEKAR